MLQSDGFRAMPELGREEAEAELAQLRLEIKQLRRQVRDLRAVFDAAVEHYPPSVAMTRPLQAWWEAFYYAYMEAVS